MVTKSTALFFAITLSLLVILCGCGSNSKNSEIVGEWVLTTVSFNGETENFSELGVDKNSFKLTFDKDGKCTTILADVKKTGTYVFNDTSIDVTMDGEEQKLQYEKGVIVLSLKYDNNTTTFTFIKSSE